MYTVDDHVTCFIRVCYAMIPGCFSAECNSSIKISSVKGHERRKKQGSQIGDTGQKCRQVAEGMCISLVCRKCGVLGGG